MKNRSIFALAAALGVATAFTFSCSSDDGGSGSAKKSRIIGVAQKGPFVQNSTVKLYELDADLQKTANSFTAKTDSKGGYEIEIDKKLASQYIALEVNGKYANEVTGKESDGAITLRAIADVKNKSEVNINALTHLEYDRILHIMAESSGMTFEAAKKQAQEEVLAALDISGSNYKNSEDMSIFGSSKSDSALLVVSVMLQSNRSTSEVAALLAEFAEEFEETGAVNSSIKAEIIGGLANVDMDSVKNNVAEIDSTPVIPPTPSSSSSRANTTGNSSDSSVGQSSSSSANTTGNSSSSVATTEGTVVYQGETYQTVAIGTQTWLDKDLKYNSNSEFDWATAMGFESSCNSSRCSSQAAREHKGICPDGWHIPNDYELDVLINRKTSGDLVAQGFSSKKYWSATSDVSCASSLEISRDTASINSAFGSTSVCTYKTSEIAVRCLKNSEVAKSIFTDSRDGKSYSAVKIGTQTWMAENLNYEEGGVCHENKPENCKTYGRLYTWNAAMSACPSDWHLPTKDEWDVLSKYVSNCEFICDAQYLKADVMDIYGFAALMGGGIYEGSFEAIGNYGAWWSTTKVDDSSIYYLNMFPGSRNSDWFNTDKSNSLSVRCLQD